MFTVLSSCAVQQNILQNQDSFQTSNLCCAVFHRWASLRFIALGRSLLKFDAVALFHLPELTHIQLAMHTKSSYRYLLCSSSRGLVQLSGWQQSATMSAPKSSQLQLSPVACRGPSPPPHFLGIKSHQILFSNTQDKTSLHHASRFRRLP